MLIHERSALTAPRRALHQSATDKMSASPADPSLWVIYAGPPWTLSLFSSGRTSSCNVLGEIEKIEGFISIERFTSLSQDGKILSLSFWHDQDAIAHWREYEQHHAAQISGRNGCSVTTGSASRRLSAITACASGRKHHRRCRRRLRPRVGLLPGDPRGLTELRRAEEHLSILNRKCRGDRGLAVRSGLRQHRQR